MGLLCLLLAALAAEAPRPVSLNGAAPGQAFDPALDPHPGGGLTYVWNSYQRGAERLYTATLRGGRLSRPRLLSPGPGVYSGPVFAATGERSGWAFWSEAGDGSWRLCGREMREGEWLPTVALAENALAPAAAAAGPRVFLAWEDHGVNPQRIRGQEWDGQQWSTAAWISAAGAPAYRPALAASGGQAWAAWDAYDNREYAVFAASWRGPPARLSASGKDGLRPALAIAGQTVAAAWIATAAVEARGVLDHRDSIEAAFHRGAGWEPAAEAADLRYGLLPQIEPRPSAMSGYSGRRRRPMLAADGENGFRLLWERKAVHDGLSDTPGQLCARQWSNGRWAAPGIVHEGLVDYRVSGAYAAGRDIHHGLWGFDLAPAAGRPVAPGEWPGWKTVKLPLAAAPARPAVEIGGRRYHLYWGDLHVHTILTPDAEGEVDEVMHFARDRAQLDVIATQENDANSWMNRNPQGAFRNHLLPESNYRLSLYFSRRYTEPGRFIALPAWEWSHRTDDNKPNHRSVLFPGLWAPILRHPENGGDFEELCEAVEAAGGLMLTQHEDFRLVNRPCDANIEVATGWGNYLRDPRKIHADLSLGYKAGFIATGDAHRRNPGTGGGLTGIYAEELTAGPIFDALRQRRVFATTGARVMMDARANGVFMGGDAETTGAAALTLRALSPRPVKRVVLVRDGEELQDYPADGRREIQLSREDRPGAGFHWYYWRIELEGEAPAYPGNMKVAEGNLAWSSPLRVRVR